MLLCPKGKTIDHTKAVVKGDLVICNTNLYMYLGCNLDKNLTIEQYLKDILQRFNFKLYLLSKIRYLLTFYAAVTVYVTRFGILSRMSHELNI